MREIFTHQDYTRVGYYQSILEANGIATFIRNQHSHNSLSELPSGIFFPSLCVVQDEDYEEAMNLLRPLYASSEVVGVDWVCAKCSENNPASFDTCWNCSAEKKAASF